MGRRLTLVEFIGRSNEKHSGKYDYQKTVYVNSHTKVIIVCPVHGDFEMTPSNHLNGCGCYHCSLEAKRTDINVFISKANKIHYSLYDYSKVIYEGMSTKVQIICPRHGVFEQTPRDHLKGNGCSKCWASKGELAIEMFCKNNNIDFIREYVFDDLKGVNGRSLRFDFFIVDFNILIEYDGKQHFEHYPRWMSEAQFETLKIYDKMKNRYCVDNDIDLYRIKYDVDIHVIARDI